MKEDYSEKVIELLCEKIDELEKELQGFRKLFNTGTTFTCTGTGTNTTVTH